MRKLTYLAVFEPTETGYGVSFPDIDGCISYGDDLEHAQKMAKEALGFHIYGMERDDDEIPYPSKTAKIDPDTNEGYIISPVTIYPDLVKAELDNRAIRTNVTIPAWLKDLAEKEGINFSKILQVALMEYLDIYPREVRK